MLALFSKQKPLPKPAVPPPPKDAFREVCETVVFVVALVLLLKLFVVEAFVIPTGSMAETLYGNQKVVTCPDCRHEYPVNSSEEVDPQVGPPQPVTAATCPNCRYRVRFAPPSVPSPPNNSGDRVLVHKALYALTGGPDRGDVVVFKYPVDPQTRHTAQNYIKRLWGLGGETVAVYRGDLYVSKTLTYPEGERDSFGRSKYPRPDDPRRLWEGPQAKDHSRTEPRYPADHGDYTYHNADAALAKFEESRQAGFKPGNPGGFELVRKSDELCLAVRRVVFDADHPSDTLAKRGVPPRWAGDGWAAGDPAKPAAFTHAGPDRNTLRYSHRTPAPPSDVLDPQGVPVLDRSGNRVREDDWSRLAVAGGTYKAGMFPPSPITNFLGYNSGEEQAGLRRPGNGAFWVPDLMLECTAQISGPGDEVTLDLGKGSRRFQATFKDGQVAVAVDGGPPVAAAPTRLTAAGRYELRFADCDGRLRVWVNNRAVPLGAGADVPPWADGVSGTEANGFTPANDLTPAAVHAAGNVTVSHLKLWQDTYYTPAENAAYADRDNPVDTFFVQPGHYLCLGDNSGFSSDSRKWGLVPDRLLLGKAQLIFYPVYPENRLGFIK